jgi:CRP-like cAMP-binding protein
MTGPHDMQRERPTEATSPGVRPEVIKDLVLDGTFEVHDGDRRICLLGRGDVIGEVGFCGTSGRRIASVITASDGQVLVLRRRLVDELMKTGPECAANVLFGLARVLADRQCIPAS